MAERAFSAGLPWAMAITKMMLDLKCYTIEQSSTSIVLTL